MCKVRGCDKCYTHPSSLRKHMKLHCNKPHVAKGGHARPGDEDRVAEGRSARERVQVSTLHPTQDVRLSPESPDELTPRSRFHHTFDSSLDYSPHRSQPLLDPLLLQRGSYRSQSSQYPCSQAGQAFAQSSRTFTSASPFQKSIVNGWYTCHTGVDSFSPKQCNNIPSL
ncbi:Zinc finger protein ZIC 4 [Oryzias melastigma]|nr:Zinc finger protein ZIC 4 [Oryzias melastigma]